MKGRLGEKKRTIRVMGIREGDGKGVVWMIWWGEGKVNLRVGRVRNLK